MKKAMNDKQRRKNKKQWKQRKERENKEMGHSVIEQDGLFGPFKRYKIGYKFGSSNNKGKYVEIMKKEK